MPIEFTYLSPVNQALSARPQQTHHSMWQRIHHTDNIWEVKHDMTKLPTRLKVAIDLWMEVRLSQAIVRLAIAIRGDDIPGQSGEQDPGVNRFMGGKAFVQSCAELVHGPLNQIRVFGHVALGEEFAQYRSAESMVTVRRRAKNG